MAWYKTGTVTVNNGNATVTGAGTAWSDNVSPGEAIYLPDGKYYEIAAVPGDGTITLASPYAGTSLSAQSYTIMPSQSFFRDLAVQAAALVNTYSSIATAAGAGKFADGDASAPGIRFVNDIDTGLARTGANEVSAVAGGQAVFKWAKDIGLTLLAGALTLTGGTVAASTPILAATQTWNAGAVAFTGVKLNVTDTASAAGSLLVDLQVGGASKFSVRKDGLVTTAGAVTIAGGLSATAQVSLHGGTTSTVSPFHFMGAANGADANAVEIRQGRYNKDVLTLVATGTGGYAGKYLRVVGDSGDVFTLDAFGNLGLGKASGLEAKITTVHNNPIRMYNVAENSQTDFLIQDSGATLAIHHFYGPGSAIKIGTNANGAGIVAAVTIDAFGNLSLSGSGNAGNLMVTTAAQIASLRLRQTQNVHVNTRNWEISTNGTAYGNLEFKVGASQFSDTYSTVMILDSSGNLNLGASAPAAGAERLYVHSGGVDAMLIEQAGTGAAASTPLYIINGGTSGDNVFEKFLTDGTAATATLRGSIDYNRAGGQVRYNTTSDGTLKHVLGDAPRSVSCDLLRTTRLREWYWLADAAKKPQISPIAQELYETFRGAVSVGGDQEDGSYRPWGVDKTAFAFHLVAGWQDHDDRIAALESENLSLRQQLADAGISIH